MTGVLPRPAVYRGPMTALEPTVPVEFRVEGLEKAFDGNRVLRGIDLEIRRGSFVAVVGGSGCGKTVLLNHMLGLLDPDAGRVLVANSEAPDAPLVDLAGLGAMALDLVHTHWGVVFQRNALFSGTVWDNLGLWLKEVRGLDDAAVTRAAAAVLAAVALPSDPAFLATPVHDLSGGMAKRVAVARALAMDPVCMFYDEPTTGLDPVTAAQIQDLLLASHLGRRPDGQRRTTVVITHDKDLLFRLRPRIVMLHEGRVFFDGPFEAFRDSPSPTIRPYFDLMPSLHHRAAG